MCSDRRLKAVIFLFPLIPVLLQWIDKCWNMSMLKHFDGWPNIDTCQSFQRNRCSCQKWSKIPEINFYDPKIKRQNAACKSKNSLEAKKIRKAPSEIRTIIITFFDSKGIIHREFVPTGQKITGAYYLKVLKRLMTRIRRIQPEYRDPEPWSLLHDNTPSHTSLIVRQFLAWDQVCVLNHPPYSPDLAPCDFSLFPKLKLKGCFLMTFRPSKQLQHEH